MARVIEYKSDSPAGPPGSPTLMSSKEVDGYLERLVKYIPGEVLAFFTPIAGVLASQEPRPATLLWVVTVVALVGVPAYLYISQIGSARSPRLYLYVLAPIAFAVWAINVNAGVSELVGIDAITAAVTLAIAVFIIPAVDIVLDYRTGKPN